MKRNSLVIFAAVTALLTVNVRSTLGTSPLRATQLPTDPIYISQSTVPNPSGAPAQPNQGAGLTVPLVLGILVLLAIGAGAWVLRSRTSSKPTQTEDAQTVVLDRETIPVIPEQASLVEEKMVPVQEAEDLQDNADPTPALQEEIVPDLQPQESETAVVPVPDLQEEIVPVQAPEAQKETIPDQAEQDLQQTAVVVQDPSAELQQKLELLQSAIETAKQKFQTLSQKLEQEITQQIQALPESILSQPDPKNLPTQQQALEKLEALQAVFLDLELPAEGYFKMGNAWFNAKKYDEAIAHYDKAITLNPDGAFAWFNTACIYALQGDAPRSARYLKQSIALNPDCLDLAQKHSEFDGVRENLSFKELLKT